MDRPTFSPSTLLTLLSLLILAALPARAQERDTTHVPADTTRTDTTAAPTDSLRPRRRVALAELVSLDRPAPGTIADPTLPVRQPVTAASEVLAEAPGAFFYDFGAIGWPHTVSFRGHPPDRTVLTLDGRPFNDPVTGRPRYDLLPLAYLSPLRTGYADLGTPTAVAAALRSFDTTRPLTELRYRRGDNALQGITAFHTQRRRLTFLGAPGLIDILGGYTGRAADNEYPGSDLRRERRLLGRLRYRHPDFALELSALHNRRRLGAQGGVIPPEGGPFEAIYVNRGQANVLASNATRRLLRTDLAMTLRTPFGTNRSAPLSSSVYWTRQTFRYRAADTLAARTDRFGAHLRQQIALDGPLGRHHFALEVLGWVDRLRDTSALQEAASRARLHLSARDSIRSRRTALTLGAGLQIGTFQTYPTAELHLRQSLGTHLHLFAGGTLAGQPVAWIEQSGFGGAIAPLSGTPGPTMGGEAGIEAQAASLHARLTVFAHRTTRPLDLYTTASDTVAARLAPSAFRLAGVALKAGWRRQARRGFYATAQATARSFLNANASPLHQRASAALPSLFGQGRLGARYAIFTDDLALDAYVEGRLWSRMRSRTLHPPTGRLVLPAANARTLGPSGTLDLHLEATIRTATLFFSYENALSGTDLQTGTLIVPVYPLPERQFRFGVYWPIFG